VSGSRDTSLRLWDIATGATVSTNKTARNMVTYIARSKTDDFFAQTSEDKTLRLWDAKSLALIRAFPAKQHIQTHCDVSSDGHYVLSSSNGFNGNGCEVRAAHVHGVQCR